jgi:N-methylhydantoinase A
MSWVVLATTATEPPARLAATAAKPAPKPVGERSVFDAGLGRRVTVPIYERSSLAPGAALKGPALIVEDGTSTYVSPRFDVTVDAGEALVLTATPGPG